jgi:hypothetical protein
MCLMWTRLQDFRLTANKLRMELRGGDKDTTKIVAEKADWFGVMTWRFYRLQLISFGLAVVSLVISLGLLYRHRVFP